MNGKVYGRRRFLSLLSAGACILALANSAWAQQLDPPKKRPNVLMIVADDLNWDTAGCFGGAAPEITLNIDRLATEGIRFSHAYVNVSICTPSRSVLLTGLYPPDNGAEGFQRIRPGTETLPAVLNKAGYLCGIIGKPLRQQELFRWSVTYRWQGTGRDGKPPAVADQRELDELRAKLRQWMVRVKDPALHVFDNRRQSETLGRFVQDYRTRAAEEVEALKPYEKRNGYRF